MLVVMRDVRIQDRAQENPQVSGSCERHARTLYQPARLDIKQLALPDVTHRDLRAFCRFQTPLAD
jgi:hypothetical protein